MIDEYPIFDLHIHTHYSACGCQEASYRPDKVLAAAGRLGFDGICFADHVGDNRGTQDAMGVRRPEALARELAGYDLAGAIPHAIGLEAEEGWAPADAAGRFLVLVSCNDGYEPADRERLASAGPRQFAEFMLERTRRAIESPLITMLPHPLLGRNRDDAVEIFGSYRDEEIAGVLDLARRRGVIVELHRHLLEDARPLISRRDVGRFCRLAREVGVKLSFGTDSHWMWHLASIRSLVALARHHGLTPDCFIGGLPDPPRR